jgi:hypothetical protein
MGYCIDQIDSKFTILSENFDRALSAIKALMKNENEMSGGSWSGGKQTERWFAWVNTSTVLEATTLADALSEWRWEPEQNEDGIYDIIFRGEKLGDDDKLFRALAPFVKCGSYISFRGEDGALWQYYFEGGKMKEKEGRVVFE